MKVADLYIRVSTDEQAEKGYSQRGQEEVLKRYCEQNHISVRRVIFEDHSAKTFLRPEWEKLLINLRQHKRQINLILFTKWDRFSRNAPDAYQMINTLKSLGVEPQAIEQPLDMSVPENKMMLAIYLTAPEIENDRRALNTFFGMRRARKEGRWTSLAPVGYINRTTPDGLKKYIMPDGLQAQLMTWAFKEIAEEKYSTEQIFKKAKGLGLRCNKNRFLVAIRNPVYCGKILIEQYKDEAAYLVKGLHEPLISEALWYEVQDILNGRKRAERRAKIMSPAMFPLANFLRCPKCNRSLCTSASKGRNGYYSYYHCSSACGYRQRAEAVNDTFSYELEEYVLNWESAEFFKTAIMDAFLDATRGDTQSRTDCIVEITELNNRITKARELLLKNDIDGSDYKNIKTESENRIAVLEAKLSEVPTTIVHPAEVAEVLNKAVEKLTGLAGIYSHSDTATQREIIGSMFAEKFTFEDLKHRTAEVDDLFRLIYQINSTLWEKKRRASNQKLCLPSVAPEAGLEPATL